MIYVLLLEQGKVYVGYSQRPNGERFLEHFNRNGSKWTMTYSPLQVLHIFPKGKLQEENEITLKMMEQYGWWNVRGGSWCQVEMDSCPPALMERQGLRMPPTLNNRSNSSSQKTIGCARCGRTSHSDDSCYARTNVNGQVLLDNSSDSESSESQEEACCIRCGRDSHCSQNCFAKTDVEGFPLYY